MRGGGGEATGAAKLDGSAWGSLRRSFHPTAARNVTAATDTAAGSDHYRRLQALKRRFDPDNVFRSTQNITPTDHDDDRGRS